MIAEPRRRLLGPWLFLGLVLLTLLGPARRVEAAHYGWALEAEATPATMWLGLDALVELELRNTGTQPWIPALGDRVAYHWRDAEGGLLIRDGARTELPKLVAPGESITLTARVSPPDRPGSYELEWAMVREDVTWYPPPEGGPLHHEVRVRAGAFDWQLVELEAPARTIRLKEGRLAELSIRLANRGDIPWDPREGDALAYHLWSEEGELLVREGRRTPMPSRVEPGEEVELTLAVEAPHFFGGAEEGSRRVCLQLEPLREGVRWYGTRPEGWACGEVEAEGLGWALVDDPTPERLAIDDAEQRVMVVLENVGSEPWAAGDRLGYQLRPLDGPGQGRAPALIEGPRVELPRQIQPGERVELEARLIPPERPGRYELRWGLVREGVRWYPEPPEPWADSGNRPRRILEVEPRRLAWALIRAETPRRLWATRSTTVEVELRNLGTESWSEAKGDHLAYHWLDEEGEVVQHDGRRSSYPVEVGPGERVVVEARIRGPRRPGVYRLQWEPVREHLRWLGPPRRLGEAQAWAAEELAPVRVRWRAAWWAVLLAGVTLAGALALRLRPPASPTARRLLEELPIVWTAAAIASLTVAFHDFSGIEARRGAAWIGASGAWILAAPLILIPRGGGPTPGRLRAIAAAVWVSAAALLALADLVYMHYFGSIVPVVALTASHHLGEVGDSAIAELERGWAWLFVVPAAGVIAAALWPASRAPEPEPRPDPSRAEGVADRSALVRVRRLVRPRLAIASLCLLLSLPALSRLARAVGGELGVKVYSERRNVARFGYLNAHLFDLARTIRERGRRGHPSEARRAEIHAWFEARAEAVGAHAAGAVQPPPGAAAGHNLLLIQVEAAQDWVIGLEVGGREVTPLLNRMRSEADWYPYLIDQTNQGKTSDAEYAVLNSQHPLGEGAICFLRADNQFFTLAHLLADRGYATLSAHPYKRGFWNRAVLHPRYGFERSLFRRELGRGQGVGWGLADGLFFERLASELAKLPEPWFAFAITLSLHHPYDEFPDNLDALELGPLEGTRVGNYLDAMNYFDRSLAALLAELDEAGLLDHTLVALYGDHDARFELDVYPEVLELAGFGGWDPAAFHRLERVPFFVRVPPESRAPRGRVEVIGGQVDVAPTLLHELGIERPRGFVGRALLPGEGREGFAAYPDGSAFGADRMFVATGEGIPREGGCFEFPRGGSRPLSECAELRDRAAVELDISRAVVDHDLHRELHP